MKVVCGAPNAREGLITIYAPPGAVIPKTNFELKVAKIRGVESKGMLCSESELNLSNESKGIIELKNKEKEKIIETETENIRTEAREIKSSSPIEVTQIDENTNSKKPKKKGWWS